ncbi:MAG: CocE/NonD family hydrolase, partial [Acidobacteriota bacterium]|nr:CocE/NonD family hydrolase [Acidobacteriota bacterium]
MKSLRTVLAQFAVSLLCLLITHAQQTAPSPLTPPPAAASQASAEVELLWGARIPVRDGVKLNATVYKPANMNAPLPVVFTLTPYIADTYHDRALYFARNGYVFV